MREPGRAAYCSSVVRVQLTGSREGRGHVGSSSLTGADDGDAAPCRDGGQYGRRPALVPGMLRNRTRSRTSPARSGAPPLAWPGAGCGRATSSASMCQMRPPTCWPATRSAPRAASRARSAPSCRSRRLPGSWLTAAHGCCSLPSRWRPPASLLLTAPGFARSSRSTTRQPPRRSPRCSAWARCTRRRSGRMTWRCCPTSGEPTAACTRPD